MYCGHCVQQKLIYFQRCMPQISELNYTNLRNQYISLLNAVLKDIDFKVKMTLKKRQAKRNMINSLRIKARLDQQMWSRAKTGLITLTTSKNSLTSKVCKQFILHQTSTNQLNQPGPESNPMQRSICFSFFLLLLQGKCLIACLIVLLLKAADAKINIS